MSVFTKEESKMIVWRGWGLVVIVIGILCNILTGLIADSIGGIDQGAKSFAATHQWVWLIGMGLSACSCWYVGVWMEKRAREKGQVVTIKETGEDVILVGRDDCFWTPVKWWSVIYGLFGLLIAVS